MKKTTRVLHAVTAAVLLSFLAGCGTGPAGTGLETPQESTDATFAPATVQAADTTFVACTDANANEDARLTPVEDMKSMGLDEAAVRKQEQLWAELPADLAAAEPVCVMK